MGEQLLVQCLSQVSVLRLFEVFLQCHQLCKEEPDGATRSISALQSVKLEAQGEG